MINEVDFVGISNSPSDYNAQDGVMASLVNLIPENGELKPVFPGTVFAKVPKMYKLLYIHRNETYVHYVFYKEGDKDGVAEEEEKYNIFYVNESDLSPDGTDENYFNGIACFAEENFKVSSMGNTLILYNGTDKNYFLWKEKSYLNLGNHLPEIKLIFGLTCEYTRKTITEETDQNELISESTIIDFGTNYEDEYWKDETVQRTVEQGICAIANKYIADKVTGAGKFLYPFLVRYALRLYDGSLTMHSAPVLMIPSDFTVAPVLIDRREIKDSTHSRRYRVAGYPCFLNARMFGYNRDSIKLYSDIIKSIDVFISAPVYSYKQSGKSAEELSKNVYKEINQVEALKGRTTFARPKIIDESYGELGKLDWRELGAPNNEVAFELPAYSREEMETKIKECSSFYLLHSFDFSEDGLAKLDTVTNSHIIRPTSGYLESLVNKEVMTDDYDSHDFINGDYGFVYNSRFSLANIKKRLFNGWNPGIMSSDTIGDDYDMGDGTTVINRFRYDVYWKINTGNDEIVLYSEADPLILNGLCGNYVYYPNTQAVEALIVKYSDRDVDRILGVATVKLTPHEFLNGAVGFTGFVSPEFKEVQEGFELPEVSKGHIVYMPNKIYTSEVNNPFFFPLTGINTVGLGELLGLSSTTKALSEGQFGQFPLYAFTDDGIWALSVSASGGFSSVQPVSRDVCNNPDSITQIDNAILFSSGRGLMMISGAETRCLTEALNGKPFLAQLQKGWKSIKPLVGIDDTSLPDIKEFVAGAFVAFYYPQQRIMIFHPKEKLAMVYSITSNQWGQMERNGLVSVANSYPATIGQADMEGEDMTCLINLSVPDYGNPVKVMAATRPLSFSSPDILKTVTAAIVRGDEASIVLYGSRNLKDWHLIGSSKNRFLRYLHGTPYKYFRVLVVGELSRYERLKGLSFDFTPKENNQLR